jgi:hypothetical protein
MGKPPELLLPVLTVLRVTEKSLPKSIFPMYNIGGGKNTMAKMTKKEATLRTKIAVSQKQLTALDKRYQAATTKEEKDTIWSQMSDILFTR